MTFFTFLLIAALGPFIIANPEPTISENYWVIESNSTAEWTQDTGDRLQAASLYFLTIGSAAFILAICLILNEDRWVTKIVSNFPNCSKPDPVWFRGRPRHWRTTWNSVPYDHCVPCVPCVPCVLCVHCVTCFKNQRAILCSRGQKHHKAKDCVLELSAVSMISCIPHSIMLCAKNHRNKQMTKCSQI